MLLARNEGVLRFVPIEKCSAHGGRPLQLEVGGKRSFDFDRLFGLDVQHDDGAGLMHRHEESFAHGEIVARVHEGRGFRPDDQRAGQALGGHSAAVHVKGKVKVAKDLQRVHPGFHLPALVSKKAGTHSDQRKKLPGANRPGKLGVGGGAFGGECEKREGQKKEGQYNSGEHSEPRRIARTAHLFSHVEAQWNLHWG